MTSPFPSSVYQVFEQGGVYSHDLDHGFFSNEKAAEETLEKLKKGIEEQLDQILGKAQIKMLEFNNKIAERMKNCPYKDQKLEKQDPWDDGCETCHTLHCIVEDLEEFLGKDDYKVSSLRHQLSRLTIKKFQLYDKCII